MPTTIQIARTNFLNSLSNDTMMIDSAGMPTNADKKNVLSTEIAKNLLHHIPYGSCTAKPSGQTLGKRLESACSAFLEATFPKLRHLRPGNWFIGTNIKISSFEQFEHLAVIEKLLGDHKELRVSFGSDYLIKPDVVVARLPESDFAINRIDTIVDNNSALGTPIREHNNKKMILHASVSCKWTLRSDRAQNARSEALNLIRNRKGGLPHIAVVTAEPLPSRLASLCYGTGDLDCIYHFALPELQKAILATGRPNVIETLDIMTEGKRLRDISDLPLDLAI